MNNEAVARELRGVNSFAVEVNRGRGSHSIKLTPRATHSSLTHSFPLLCSCLFSRGRGGGGCGGVRGGAAASVRTEGVINKFGLVCELM